MLKNYLTFLIAVVLAVSLTGCKDDDSDEMPTFGQIQISPQKDVYHVGDVVTCSITRTSPGTGDLRKSSYWWYASWWFSDASMKADFQEFDDNNVCTSEEITLTKPGEVTLYFFGKLDYPHYDYRKVEIGRVITVVE